MKTNEQLIIELGEKTARLIEIRKEIKYYCSKQFYCPEINKFIHEETSLCNRINHIKQRLTYPKKFRIFTYQKKRVK